MKFTFTIFMSFILGLQLYAVKPEKTIYKEIYRPQFHFSPEKQVLEDICGLVFYEKEYHLFYHYHRFNIPENKQIGHAISNDLIHWDHISFDLFEDSDLSSSLIAGGSVIMDEKNMFELQDGENQTMLFFYSDEKHEQKMAYSKDKGRSWMLYKSNLNFDSQTDLTNCPKVFFHKATNRYIMLLHGFHKNTGEEGISFYSSEDLQNWKYRSHIDGYHERVDLVECAINRRPDDSKWVLFDTDGSYQIGNFDGEKFTPESQKLSGDLNKGFYGPQTFNNLPEEDHRIIQMAWLNNGEFQGMSFKGQMSFPCEISLRKYIEGIRLIRKPIQEIEVLYDKKDYRWEDKLLIPGINQNLISRVKGECFYFKGSFNLKSTDNFGFLLRMNKKKDGTELIFTTKNNQLSLLGSKAVFEPSDGKINLEILLDRSSVELFVNDGKVSISSCFSPEDGANGFYLFTIGGEVLVEKLDIHPLLSILNPEEQKEK